MVPETGQDVEVDSHAERDADAAELRRQERKDWWLLVSFFGGFGLIIIAASFL